MNWDLLVLIAICVGLVFALDDLFIDLYAFVARLKPRRLNKEDRDRLRLLPQKRIGIIVANWHEEDVLEQMVTGNISRLDYINYTFFLGVYPNDAKTLAIARDLESRFREVKVIVNSRPGPTTKGQMLNEVARSIFEFEKENDLTYDLLLMQDSEDVFHPLSLSVINEAADQNDFIQVPIFSFDVEASQFVGGTYLDEFAESHSKDLLVRDHMGAGIPSAGVGTALSRKLVLFNLEQQNGNLLREDTLTEDYDLGLNAKKNGFKSTFACAYQVLPNGKWDFVATRELFPQKVSTAIRQKTRWTLGIVFQGTKNIGWSGEMVDQYFLMRDRRGPFNALMMVLNFGLLFLFVASFLLNLRGPGADMADVLYIPATLNFTNMFYRMVRRSLAVWKVNSGLHALLAPLRWPLGNFINMMCAGQALRGHVRSLRTGQAPKWDKTAHVLPNGFGRTPSMPSILENPTPAPVLAPARARIVNPADPAAETTDREVLR